MADIDEEANDQPRLWFVLVFNDDATPMDFVVHLLMQVFGKGPDDASQTMLDIHHHGIAVCALYRRQENAMARIAEATGLARAQGHPLELRAAPGDEALIRPTARRNSTIFRWLRKVDQEVWNAFLH